MNEVKKDWCDSRKRTLGDVLYADGTRTVMPETDWVRLLQCIAAGDQLALHELYQRTHRIVFTLVIRIMRNREAAEELTLDVFHDVWRRAASYDAASGTVLGWIMNQARSRAIDRLRFEGRKKRTDSDQGSSAAEIAAGGSDEAIDFTQQCLALRHSLAFLTPEERQAIETAFFGELTYAEVAARLNQPLGTVKTRIRSGLIKLRRALSAGAKEP